jgi:hypothetical protein
MSITTQQLAEILIGVARSQQAIIDAVEGMKAGFKGTYLGPALESAARLRSVGRAASLQNYPSRLLVQCLGRGLPNMEQMVKDLEELLSGGVAPSSAVAPAIARALPHLRLRAVYQQALRKQVNANTTQNLSAQHRFSKQTTIWI